MAKEKSIRKGNTGKGGGQYQNTNASKHTEDEILQIGEELIKWLENKNNIFFEKFLLQKKLYGSYLNYYKEKYQSFSKLIEQASSIQAFKLQEGGLLKDFDASMTKFCLINHHGMKSERTENENKESGNITITKRVVNGK